MKDRTPSLKQLAQIRRALSLQQCGRTAEAAARCKTLLTAFPGHPQLLTALGVISIQQNDIRQGIKYLGESLQADPNQPETLCNFGMALANLGRMEAALVCFEKAIALRAEFAIAYNNRGSALQFLRRLEEAEDSFRQALELKPDYAEAYFNRGNALVELNRLAEAIDSFQHAMVLKPNHAEAFYNCGNVLKELNRLDEAVINYERAFNLKPEYAEAFFNCGNALKDLNRPEAAVGCYDRVIALKPDFALAYNNRGYALKELQRPHAALADFERAIALIPEHPFAYVNRGIVLMELKQYEQALECFNLAIRLQPDFADAYNNRGNALRYLRRLDDSLADFQTAIALKPDAHDVYCNRGNTLKDLKRLDEALASYEHAISLKPDYADAHWNKGLLKILAGEYREGWSLYEWRWKCVQSKQLRNFKQALWLGGQAVAGKTVLLYPEQGLGDFIQFCRYAPQLAALGAYVLLETPAVLIAVMRKLKGKLHIIGQGEPLPAFDFQCPLLSLPLAFETRLETIPADIPYLFAEDYNLKVWRGNLGAKSGFRVGLAWAGSSAHRNDCNRSIPLTMLAPLLRLPCEFHSLQKEMRADDERILAEFRQIRPHHEALADFSDTAALIQEMDLVIAVDTSVAHLAGAMGKPVWILLTFAADYRWLLDGTDSPWYPTATLIRQLENGDWSSVVSLLAGKLKAMIA